MLVTKKLNFSVEGTPLPPEPPPPPLPAEAPPLPVPAADEPAAPPLLLPEAPAADDWPAAPATLALPPLGAPEAALPPLPLPLLALPAVGVLVVPAVAGPGPLSPLLQPTPNTVNEATEKTTKPKPGLLTMLFQLVAAAARTNHSTVTISHREA
jgi:hypothetical protein